MAESTVVMYSKVVRETGYRYFVDGLGNVIKQDRKTKVNAIAHPTDFTPEKGFFYFLNADGNVAKTVRVTRAKKEVPVAA